LGLSRPTRLSPEHDLDQFRSGESAIDNWLRNHARRNESSGASRTFVVAADGNRAIAFYTLSSSVLPRQDTRTKYTHNMPNEIPVVLLGQLGVDQAYQGRGLARGMIKDAAIRTLTVIEEIGVAALVVDALDDRLIPFYSKLGFDSFLKERPQFMGIRTKDLKSLYG